MSKPYRQKLELRPKVSVKTTVKYRLMLSGSALAVAVLFGVGVFMYGNIGNNTESLAAKKTSEKIYSNITVPDGPVGINTSCSDEAIILNWTNILGSGNESQTDGILILKKAGLVTEEQAINDFTTDSTGNSIMDTTSMNGWKVAYNGNLVSTFTDYADVTGINTYLVYEKNNGVKCTAAKNAGRIFVLNGKELSGNISGETKIDGLYLPSTCTLIVDEKSSLTIHKGATMNIAGTFVLKGEMDDNASSWTFSDGAEFIYDCNGTRKNNIPVAKWEAGSTCLIKGVENREPAGLGQTFANFIWDCANQTSNATIPGMFNVTGNLKVVSTGPKVKALSFEGANSFGGDISVNDNTAKIEMKRKTEMVLNGTSPQVILGKWNFEILTVNNPTEFFISGEVTVSKTINMKNGTIKIMSSGLSNGSLKIANEAVVNRTNGTLIGALACQGVYDLNYNASVTTGDELTANENILRNLTINCSGDLILDKTVNVNGTLLLINGKVITGNNEVNLKDNSSNSLKEFSSASYIVGNLRRAVNGKNNYDFPVGTSSNYQLLSANLNGARGFSNVLAQFINEQPNAADIITETRLNGTLVGNMLNSGYWSLIPNNPMIAGTCNVTLHSSGQTNSAPSVGCYCVMMRKDNSSKWNFIGKHSMKTQSINNGTVTAARSQVNSLGDFAIAYSGASIILSKTSLTASLINHQYTDIVWRTTAELNFPTLAVERSQNSIDFEIIGEMKNKGQVSDMEEFTFRDARPLTGISYYRVKQTDMDGIVTYSDIRFINNSPTADAANNTQK